MTTNRARRRAGEAGVTSIWALAVTAGAFTVLLGLVVDGGNTIEARLEAARTAAQAARLAADQLSASSVRDGAEAVRPAAASDSARRYLTAAGTTGMVQVHDDSVTVTITARSPTRILGVIGVDSLPVHEQATATGVTEEDVG